MLKAIILDFGGVLTRIPPRAAVLRKCEAEAGLAHGTLTDLLFASDSWYALSTGRISVDEYWMFVKESLGGCVPPALEPFRFNSFAYEALNKRVVDLACRLHKRHRMGLLSNATVSLEALLAEYALCEVFDVVVNSSRTGMRKPDPGIYLLAVERMECEAEECLFVDDKERNIQVAQELGLQTITFTSGAQLARQLRALGIDF